VSVAATQATAAPDPVHPRDDAPAHDAVGLVAGARVGSPSPGRGTPWLALDVSIAVDRFHELQAALPGTQIHYAVKANPHPVLLERLRGAGSRFDVASPAEVHAALAAGAAPDQLVYSNPVKRRADVRTAYELGVRLFAVDSPGETRKVAEAAPGASVLVRLVTSGQGSDWPLSRKYGCSTREAVLVLVEAAALGLDPAGVSFHVGSQQRDPGAWRAPILAAAGVFAEARRVGLAPWLLDLGGGFPALHEGHHPSFASYGSVIQEALQEAFGVNRPVTIVEPGRGIVGDAGTVVASVVSVLWRGGTRWVFIDAGVFTGLVETLDEGIRYRLRTSADGGSLRPAVLAGPTCDSADVLYERTPVQLPAALAEGDLVCLLSAGAYTSCYSTVGFNGFEPLPTRLLGRAGP
jgi:ornithine decarboxylase